MIFLYLLLTAGFKIGSSVTETFQLKGLQSECCLNRGFVGSIFMFCPASELPTQKVSFNVRNGLFAKQRERQQQEEQMYVSPVVGRSHVCFAPSCFS